MKYLVIRTYAHYDDCSWEPLYIFDTFKEAVYYAEHTPFKIPTHTKRIFFSNIVEPIGSPSEKLSNEYFECTPPAPKRKRGR